MSDTDTIVDPQADLRAKLAAAIDKRKQAGKDPRFARSRADQGALLTERG
jgi:hypothetical protein